MFNKGKRVQRHKIKTIIYICCLKKICHYLPPKYKYLNWHLIYYTYSIKKKIVFLRSITITSWTARIKKKRSQEGLWYQELWYFLELQILFLHYLLLCIYTETKSDKFYEKFINFWFLTLIQWLIFTPKKYFLVFAFWH